MDTVNINSRLAAALPAMPDIKRNAKSHHGKYASLDNVLDAVRPVLKQHGLAVHQHPVTDDTGAIAVVTRVVSVDGEVLEFPGYYVDPGKGPQSAGSAITYARRYSLVAILGLATEDDDDGNRSQQSDRFTERGSSPSEAQIRKLAAIMRAAGVTERPERLKWLSHVLGRDITSTKNMSRQEMTAVIDRAQRELRPLPTESAADDHPANTPDDPSNAPVDGMG